MGNPGSIPGSGRSPGEGKWHPTPVLLPGESHGGRSLECVGSQRVGHDWELHFHFLSLCCSLGLSLLQIFLSCQFLKLRNGNMDVNFQNFFFLFNHPQFPKSYCLQEALSVPLGTGRIAFAYIVVLTLCHKRYYPHFMGRNIEAQRLTCRLKQFLAESRAHLFCSALRGTLGVHGPSRGTLSRHLAGRRSYRAMV